MIVLRRVSTLVVLLVFAACADNTAPDVEGMSLAKGGNGGGRRATTETSTTESSATSTETSTESVAVDAVCTVPNGIRHAADAPPLVTYDTTIAWVVGDEDEIEISYQDGQGEAGRPFLLLVVPGDAVLVDDQGNAVPVGETVDINIKLDATCFFVEFQPHGSTFYGYEPAEIWLSTWYAELDGVHGDDLSVLYQPDSDFDWEALSTVFEKKGKWLKAPIQHFSNYAVAW